LRRCARFVILVYSIKQHFNGNIKQQILFVSTGFQQCCNLFCSLTSCTPQTYSHIVCETYIVVRACFTLFIILFRGFGFWLKFGRLCVLKFLWSQYELCTGKKCRIWLRFKHCVSSLKQFLQTHQNLENACAKFILCMITGTLIV
jgi:hypothetical protein